MSVDYKKAYLRFLRKKYFFKNVSEMSQQDLWQQACKKHVEYTNHSPTIEKIGKTWKNQKTVEIQEYIRYKYII